MIDWKFWDNFNKEFGIPPPKIQYAPVIDQEQFTMGTAIYEDGVKICEIWDN